MAKCFMPLVQAAIHHRDCDSRKGDGVGQQQEAYVIGFHEWRCGCYGVCKLEIAAAHHHKLSVPTATRGPAIKALVWLAEEPLFNTASALLLSSQVVVYGHCLIHTPSTAFRHLPPNSARFSYATEGALFISAQLSTDAVSALRKVRVLI